MNSKAEADDVIMAYEVLLERKPESDEIIAAWANRDIKQLWQEIAHSPEFFYRFKTKTLNQDDKYQLVNTKMGPMIVNLNDKVISQLLLMTGDFETNDIQVAINIIKNVIPNWRPEIFLDIGANIGTHTFAALNCFGFKSAISIEPSSTNFHLLKTNTVLQQKEQQIKLYNAALGNKAEKISLILSTDNYGDHRIQNQYIETQDTRKELADMITLDNIAEKNTLTKDAALIWCDTQGYDFEILKTLASDQQLVNVPLVIEFWPYGLKQFDATIESMLSVFANYSIYNLKSAVIKKLTHDEIIEFWQNLDELFVDLLLIRN